jgi:hypothetical protein
MARVLGKAAEQECLARGRNSTKPRKPVPCCSAWHANALASRTARTLETITDLPRLKRRNDIGLGCRRSPRLVRPADAGDQLLKARRCRRKSSRECLIFPLNRAEAMANQMIHPPGMEPAVPDWLTADQRVALWADLLDANEALLLAGLRHQIGPAGDLREAYRSWYAQQMEERDRSMRRLAENLHRRGVFHGR